MLDRSLDAVGRIIIHLLFFGGIFKDDVLVRARFIHTITELCYHVYAGTLDIRLLSSWPSKSSFMLYQVMVIAPAFNVHSQRISAEVCEKCDRLCEG